MLEMRVAHGCGPTARVLAQLIRAAGVSIGTAGEQTAVLCWGVRYQGPLASLNRNTGRRNKLEELQHIGTTVSRPPIYLEVPHDQENYPILARGLHHVGGTDIRLALQPEDAERLRRQGMADYFTGFVPSTAEYRVWIYRRRHLGTYRKVFAHPEVWLRRNRVGRNYHNGWAFELVDAASILRGAVDAASRAVDALSLDFGAVDVLHGTNGQYYVLEVNSAPGIQGPTRQAIQSLARKIVKWHNNGFPRRNGDHE